MNLKEKKKHIAELNRKGKEEKERREKELWDNLLPFNGDPINVPRLPIPLTEYHVDKMVQAGAIPKKDLVDQKWYIGDYRNAKIGLWGAEDEKFKIRRFKYGYFLWDDCNHFEDDDNFALFVPLREATEEEIKDNLEKE